MWIFAFLALMIISPLISAFTTDQIMERLYHVEERINTESKFRREDFKTLFEEISGVKTMLQQNVDEKLEEKEERKEKGTDTVQISDKNFSELKDLFSRVMKAFGEEKSIHIRLREEIPTIQRNIRDLRIKVEQNHAMIEETIRNLEPHLEEVMKRNTETMVTMSNEIKALKEVQGQCVADIKVNINLTEELAEILSNGELQCTEKEQANKKDCEATTPEVTTPMSATKSKSCKDLYNDGHRQSRVYEIELVPGTTISVYCDMKTDGGGWTVFQRRMDGSVDFYRNWDEYKDGFGDLDGEFWLGNKYMNLLTDTDDTHELRVDLKDQAGSKVYANYRRFKIGPENTQFRLEVSGYSGTAGDSLDKSSKETYGHSGMSFSTKDRDNDNWSGDNCAVEYKGAWWYNNCFDSNLNSIYHQQSKCDIAWVCIVWNRWKGSGYSLKFTEMKLR